MSFPPTCITDFSSPTAPVGAPFENQCMLDPFNGVMTLYSTTGGGSPGLKQWLLNTGALIKTATIADMAFPAGDPPSPTISSPMICLYESGNIIGCNQFWADNSSSAYVQIDRATLKYVNGINISDAGGGSPSFPYVPPTPSGMAPVSIEGFDFFVMDSLVGGQVSIFEANASFFNFAGFLRTVTEGNSYSVGTKDLGIVISLGIGGGVLNTEIGVYATEITGPAHGYNPALWPGTPNPGIFSAKTGTVSAAAIDATWTHIGQISQPGYDYSDDNVIFFATTLDAVANQNYLVKINPATCAVIWATPIPLGMPAANPAWTFSSAYIDGGTYVWCSNGDIFEINTTTGALAPTITTDLLDGGASTFDYNTYSLYGYLIWVFVTPPPYQGPSFPSASGTDWIRVQVLPAFVFPARQQIPANIPPLNLPTPLPDSEETILDYKGSN